MKRLGLSSVVVLLVVLYGLCGLGFAADSTVFPDGGFVGRADFADDGRDFGPSPGEERAFMSPEHHRAMKTRLFGPDGVTIGNRVTQVENQETYNQHKQVMPDGLDAGVSQEWVRQYGNEGAGTDVAVGMVVDASANTYVTGTSRGLGPFTDIATIKYDPDGKVLWTKRYNGTGQGNDEASGIAVDNAGNVYVTGWSYVPGSSYDYATVKYAPDGNLLWEMRYNGPMNGSDYAHAIAVDDNGNVYVTGTSDGCFLTIKYSQ
jgi:hypothetical protein